MMMGNLFFALCWGFDVRATSRNSQQYDRRGISAEDLKPSEHVLNAFYSLLLVFFVRCLCRFRMFRLTSRITLRSVKVEYTEEEL